MCYDPEEESLEGQQTKMCPYLGTHGSGAGTLSWSFARGGRLLGVVSVCGMNELGLFIL